MAVDTYPPYTPMPSLGHELGLMFGFLALCIVVMGVYIVIWRAFEARLQTQDLARRKALHSKNATNTTDPLLGTTTTVTGGKNGATTTAAKGAFTIGADGVHEKMLDRYAMPEGRVELPVHGMGMGVDIDNHVNTGVGNGIGIGKSMGKGIGIGSGIYGKEKWNSSLNRVGSPLSPVSPLNALGGSGTGTGTGTGVVSPVRTGSVGSAGFASAVGIALTSAEEVGERHVSLGRDVREGMSPVEIGPGIEVEVEEVEKEEQGKE